MFWGFVNFFLNHILTKSLLIYNFFHFLNSVDLNELLLTVLAIHLILSFFLNILVVCWCSPISLFLMGFLKNPKSCYFPSDGTLVPRRNGHRVRQRYLAFVWSHKVEQKQGIISGIIFISSTISQKGFILLDVYKHLI